MRVMAPPAVTTGALDTAGVLSGPVMPAAITVTDVAQTAAAVTLTPSSPGCTAVTATEASSDVAKSTGLQLDRVPLVAVASNVLIEVVVTRSQRTEWTALMMSPVRGLTRPSTTSTATTRVAVALEAVLVVDVALTVGQEGISGLVVLLATARLALVAERVVGRQMVPVAGVSPAHVHALAPRTATTSCTIEGKSLTAPAATATPITVTQGSQRVVTFLDTSTPSVASWMLGGAITSAS